MACTEEYIPTDWVNNARPAINATNLNHIEIGIKTVTDGCIDLTNQVGDLVLVPIGGIIMFNGSVVPDHYALCDGTNGTPNLKDRFIRGAENMGDVGDTGGVSHSTMPEHTHSMDHSHTGSTNTTGNHKHEIGKGLAQMGNSQETYCAKGFNVSDEGCSTEGNHSHSVTISQTSGLKTGASAKDDGNLPPYYVLAFIMRIT